ncbi:MAG: hypothetical protein CSA81_10425 [Acidobacteria bacterium]|nr:MAG: hypothetical protein CSA81_10425 [Acidobacteriota bacterium]PIE91234.1 MAG: hypothetical protein CR997_02150 [Acidobacteriota bacterium]
MRLKFFPGNELAPPNLLGEIIDLDKPQHVLANVFMEPDTGMVVKPIRKLSEKAQEQLLTFAKTINPNEVSRIEILDIMSYSTRKKSMC